MAIYHAMHNSMACIPDLCRSISGSADNPLTIVGDGDGIDNISAALHGENRLDVGENEPSGLRATCTVSPEGHQSLLEDGLMIANY